jgi:hypothetical protein
MIHEFRLSPLGKGGVSCDEGGAFVGAVPVLVRTRRNGRDEWRPRDCDDLSKKMSALYGLPIDMSSKSGGLRAIANAFNDGDMARAQVATLLLRIPNPPSLSKGAPSRQETIKLAGELQWGGLLKADWTLAYTLVGRLARLTAKADNLPQKGMMKSALCRIHKGTEQGRTIPDPTGPLPMRAFISPTPASAMRPTIRWRKRPHARLRKRSATRALKAGPPATNTEISGRGLGLSCRMEQRPYSPRSVTLKSSKAMPISPRAPLGPTRSRMRCGPTPNIASNPGLAPMGSLYRFPCSITATPVPIKQK